MKVAADAMHFKECIYYASGECSGADVWRVKTESALDLCNQHIDNEGLVYYCTDILLDAAMLIL